MDPTDGIYGSKQSRKHSLRSDFVPLHCFTLEEKSQLSVTRNCRPYVLVKCTQTLLCRSWHITFSLTSLKIADLQAHNNSLCEALRALDRFHCCLCLFDILFDIMFEHLVENHVNDLCFDLKAQTFYRLLQGITMTNNAAILTNTERERNKNKQTNPLDKLTMNK